MLAMASTMSTARATGPEFESISTRALDPVVGGGAAASDWRKRARVAAEIGVYLTLKASRWVGGIQVVKMVRDGTGTADGGLVRGMLRSECPFVWMPKAGWDELTCWWNFAPKTMRSSITPSPFLGRG